MSFEAFEVHLYPLPESRLYGGNTMAQLDTLLYEIQAQWPEFRPDEVEIKRLYEPLQSNERLYAHETTAGLIQLSAQLNGEPGSIILVLRFAYCNPRGVQDLFVNIVARLMQSYQFYCHVLPDLAPEHQGEADDIYSVAQVCSLLTASIEYNRRLWQVDTGTGEEAVLRPGDAIARFIAPLYVG